jgi:flotillin
MGLIIGLVIVLLVVLAIITLMIWLSRYKRCPSDKILVIYGKVRTKGQKVSSRCIHGGAAFIWPVVQSYAFLELTPMSINVDLRKALSRQNIRIDVPSRFTVAISTEDGVMQNAAERLLRLKLIEIEELAKDIIFGQLRLVVAQMDIEEINTDRDKFLEAVSRNVETELKKIGLRLINVNVTDISDESGYIEALGKEAAAKAVNDARKSVAEQTRDGSIGEALAQKEQRIEVAGSNATAVEGENRSRAAIAESDAVRREKEAESLKRATAAEKVQAAKALQEAYLAQREAEATRAQLEQATQQADIIVKADIEKSRIEIAAEAEAEATRRRAKGEADAIFAKMQAQAKGINEILTKQADGLREIVKAANNNPDSAVRLLIADKLQDIVKLQVEAVKGIKIDKVTVWDNLGGGKDGNGNTATANFVSGMLKSVPPLNDVYKMAGLELPEYLGKKVEVGAPDAPKPAKKSKDE